MEETTNIKDLFLIVLRKAKYVLVLMLAFGVIGGSIKLFPWIISLNSDAEKSKRAIEFNLAFEKYNSEKSDIEFIINKNQLDIDNTEKYMEESQIFKINPYYEYVSELQLFFNSNGKNINNDTIQQLAYYYYELANSAELSDKIAQELSISYETRYLKELYSVSIDNNIITIKAIGNEEGQPTEIVNQMLNFLQDKQGLIRKNVGEHSINILNQSNYVKIDNDLVASQNKIRDLVKQLKTDLESENAELKKLVEPVSESMLLSSVIISTILFVVIGLFLGAILGIIFVLSEFFISNRIINQIFIKNFYGINYLANLPINTINNTKWNFIDKFISKLEGNSAYSISQKEHLEKLKFKILLLIEDTPNCNILLTGSVDEAYLIKMCELLQNEFSDNSNISFSYGKNILMSADTMQKASKSTTVILVEQNQKSSMDIVLQEIDSIKEMNEKIMGYIMI